MRHLARLTVIRSLLAAALAGCGDDCVGAARSGEDGLVAFGACGDFVTPTPTATPTPAP